MARAFVEELRDHWSELDWTSRAFFSLCLPAYVIAFAIAYVFDLGGD